MSDHEWLLVPISQKTKTEALDRYIDQALSAGYPGPRDWRTLENNKQRVAWLSEVRADHWNRMAMADIQERARKMTVAFNNDARRGAIPKARSNQSGFQGITATEADAFIATLPMPEGIK